MDLVIRGCVIRTPVKQILEDIKRESNTPYLKFIGKERYNDITITCPYHSNGQENHPSCHVFTKIDDPNVYYGTVHCFACGIKRPLYNLVGWCFGEDDEFGKQWLYEKYADPNQALLNIDEEISLNKSIKKESFNISLIEQANQYAREYHPYIEKRKITESVRKKFLVGYNRKNNSITFPVWDKDNNLVGITERYITEKKFHIPAGMDKPIYLLNFILKEHISTVYVCESQINALTLWSWGYPAIALFGTGSKEQYDILNKCPIRGYILCFDGDEAGYKARLRFLQNVRKDTVISYIEIPKGKDVNDLEKEEFDQLPLY